MINSPPFTHCRMQPEVKLFDDLKVIAERAMLDPEKFWPHKFRATFASLSGCVKCFVLCAHPIPSNGEKGNVCRSPSLLAGS